MYNVFQIVNWLRVRNNKDLQSKNVNAEELTQMKAMKLLYYIQATNLVTYGKRLFNSDIVAWKWGPAVEEVHEKYRHQRGIIGTITRSDLNDYHLIEKDAKAKSILNDIYAVFGSSSAADLMRMTHREMPWRSTAQSQVIPDAKIKKYFESINFRQRLDNKLKKDLIDKLFYENKQAMDWLKDR